jgi:hypothetical protein
MTHPPDKPALRRVLRVKDLVFFYVTAVLGMRWVSTAAAAGPSALLIWVLAALCLFVPLAFTVIELSSRYPEEGGIYVWTKHAFGDFAGFMTGWTYWGANLTYLPGLLYFTASTGLYIFGSRYAHLQDSPTYFIVVAMVGLVIAAAMNIVGLEVGKWLSAGARSGPGFRCSSSSGWDSSPGPDSARLRRSPRMHSCRRLGCATWSSGPPSRSPSPASRPARSWARRSSTRGAPSRERS